MRAENERINNPLNPAGVEDNRFPDPHIKIFTNPDTGNEAMYVYVGHDDGKDRFIMRDWFVLYSEDLIHWQCKKTLDRKDTYLPDDSEDCWACDCVQSPFDGKYYLYYSYQGYSTGVAVSDRPDGPFVDARGKTPILPPGITPTNSYDPDIILPDDEDPRAWIVFGSDWTDHYWAMQLDESMTEVVPGTARKVPVYPSEDDPTELLGVLRSDQAEAFRYGDTWYLYWAGRYATSKNRLGPYIFRGNIGADVPHYPDGRAFIDHGSFLEWHGQWFYAVSHGAESPFYRKSYLMYLHVCDDGTLTFDKDIRRCGVGQYCARWDRIEAECYMRMDTPALHKVDLKKDGQHVGFGIAQASGTQSAHYPHLYDMQANSTLTLCLKAEAGAKVEALVDEALVGEITLTDATCDFTEVTFLLTNPEGEHTFTLRLTGGLTIDWFKFN